MSIANKIVVGLVGLTVMAVIFSAMLPIMGEVTSAEDTFTNEGYYYMTDLGEQTISYTFDGSKWTIDGEDANIIISDDTTLIAGEEVIVRTTGLIRGKANLSPSTMEITVSATGITGTATVSGNTTSVNIVADIYYCAVIDKTDYVLTKYNTPTYLNENSEILADGMAGYKSGSACLFRIEGSINDGLTIYITPSTLSDSLTITDLQFNYTKMGDYVDLYKVNSITFTTTFDNSTPDDPSDDVVRNQVFTSYVAPYEVTSEKTYHPDGPTTAILNMLPIIIGAGLLLGAIAFMIVTRK